MAVVETWAEEMVELGGDRSSLVIAFGGGIVTTWAVFWRPSSCAAFR